MKRLNVLFSVICFLFMALMTACQDDVLTPVQEEEKTEQNGFWIKEVDEQDHIIGETKYTTTKTANVSGTGTYSHNDRVNLSTTSGYTLYYRKESQSSYTSANGSTYTIPAIQSNYYVKAEKKVTITATASASPSAGGSVTCTDNNNGTWSLKATANTGYSFDKWTTTAGTIASATSSSTTLTTSSNATVTGNFKATASTTGTVKIYLSFNGNSISQFNFKIDGSSYTGTGLSLKDGDLVKSLSLSSGSHTIEYVRTVGDIDGSSSQKIFAGASYGHFEKGGKTISSFTVTGGGTTTLNMVVNGQ